MIPPVTIVTVTPFLLHIYLFVTKKKRVIPGPPYLLTPQHGTNLIHYFTLWYPWRLIRWINWIHKPSSGLTLFPIHAPANNVQSKLQKILQIEPSCHDAPDLVDNRLSFIFHVSYLCESTLNRPPPFLWHLVTTIQLITHLHLHMIQY